jgi:predicted lipase
LFSLFFDEAGAQVHQGYYETYLAIKGIIFEHIASAQKSCPKCTSLRVVGHSLGGAISTLVALELSEAHSSLEVSAWTTGSPRMANEVFASAYNAAVPNTWRMTANDDITVHLPLKTQGFYHVATEVWDVTVDDQETYKVCKGGEDPKCSDSVGLLKWNSDDHMRYAVSF